MKDFIKTFENMFDAEWFRENVINLYRIERRQTTPAYVESAKYIYDLLKKEGFDAEYVEFPADGKTMYQDQCMPLAWDVSKMKLTILSDIPKLSDPVVADFEREPFSVVKHSVSTPPEGMDVRIVTESQMKAGVDVSGALVLFDQSTRPRCAPVRMALDLGAVGWVSDFCEDPHRSPDTYYWGNSETEYGMWHVFANERDFISFHVTERVGGILRQACSNGVVKAHMVSDAKRYEGAFPAVSALLKGEDEREIWILSHTCEPLIDDNSDGVIASIGMLKALRQLRDEGKIKLRYSLRVVFASELYGMAAMCEYYGGDLSKRAIGGISTDGFTAGIDKAVHKELNAREGADLPGFAGNILMHLVTDNFNMHYPDVKVNRRDHGMGDDTFCNDSTISMPTVWLMYNSYGFHHNSVQNEDMLDTSMADKHFAYISEWLRAMSALTEKEVAEILPYAVERANKILADEAKAELRPGTDVHKRMEYLYNREVRKIRNLILWGNEAEIENTCKLVVMPDDVGSADADDGKNIWFDYCENFVFARVGRGFPHNLNRVPPEKRVISEAGMLYNKFAEVFSKFDGVKTLRDAIIEAEWDTGYIYSEQEIKRWLFNCIMLAEHEYLRMKAIAPVTKNDIEDALAEIGVNKGDVLLVHSSLSGIGYVEGGADAAVDALCNVLGEDGTFLAPIFTFPYIMFDGDINKNYRFRPYDMRPDGALRDKTVGTGALPKAMAARDDSFRSGHASHEWVALGKDAEEFVAAHGMFDAPAGETSPMKMALEKNGSVVFLGCHTGSNTFLHFVETMANVPYTEPAFVQYIDDSNRTKTMMIERQLFGCRNFYGGLGSDFYNEALRRGLHIYSAKLGLATIYRMELRELYDIASQMISEDKFALLCKKDGCKFCKKHM